MKDKHNLQLKMLMISQIVSLNESFCPSFNIVLTVCKQKYICIVCGKLFDCVGTIRIFPWPI